jgi:biotin operon repressor
MTIQKINKIHQTNKIHTNEYLFNESNSKRKGVILYDYSSIDKSSSYNLMKYYKMKRIHKMKLIKDMNKTELVELTNDLQSEIHDLNETNDMNESLITELKIKLESSSKDGRKSQVLDLLRKHHTISILNIARSLNISTKNVSSQLTYLRSDGYVIFTDNFGKKMLIEDKSLNETQPTNEEDSLNEEEHDESDSNNEDDVKLEDTL